MSDKAAKIEVFMLAAVAVAIGLSVVRPHSFAAFFSVMTVVAMAGLWEAMVAMQARRSWVRKATFGMRKRTSFATPSEHSARLRCFCLVASSDYDTAKRISTHFWTGNEL